MKINPPTLRLTRRHFARLILLATMMLGNGFALADVIHVYPRAKNGMPISVIQQKELKSYGYLTLGDVVRNLTMNPIVNDAYSTQDGRTNANLRGLGTKATGILLNGEPLPYSPLDQLNGAAVDLRMIPITAIERIEILPASNGVENGSGNIGGSINIVLIENFNNVSGELWQTVTEDGGAETLLSFRNGRRINNRSYDYTIAWYHRDAIMASERDFSSTADHRPRGGDDLRNPISSPPTISDSSLSAPLLADSACPSNRTQVSVFGTACVINLNQFLDLASEDERLNLALGADWLFDNGIRFELDIAYTDGKTGYRRSPAAFLGAVNATQNIFYRPLDTGVAHAEVKDRATHISSLTSGKIKNWDWRAGLVYGRSTASRTQFNSVLIDRLQDALLGNGGINGNRTYNPFGVTPQNAPSLINFITTDWNEYGDWKEIRLFGESGVSLFDLPGGSAQFEFGLESATESLKQRPSPAAIQFRIANSGTVIQVDDERNRSAAWATAQFPFHNRWSANVGLRSDDYDGNASASSAQFSMVYQTTDEVQFRTGYSQGFRAPTLAETSSRVAPGNTILRRGSSNTLLEAEESESYYFGVVWRSITIPGLQVSIDTWKTRQTNLITPQPNPLAATPAITLQNGGTLLSQAADLDAKYVADLSLGQFTFGTQQTFVERLTSTQGAFTAEQSATLPDYRSNYFVDWNRGRHGATVNLFYASDYDTPGGVSTASGREMVETWHSLDLQYRFKMNALNGGMFRVGCRNCTDEDPPFSDSSIFGFNANFHDPRGMLLYASWEQVF